MQTKKCTKCEQEKTVDNFYPRKDRPGKYVAQCRPCSIKSNYKYRDKEHQKKYKVNYYKKNPLRKLTNDLKKYGLTVEKYNSMLESQHNSCAICSHQNIPGKRMFVDHCHSSGTVRGLLCSSCNFLLGQAKDSKEVLSKAIIYLEKYEKET